MKKKRMIARSCFITVRVRLINTHKHIHTVYSTISFSTEISGANGKQCVILYILWSWLYIYVGM